MNVLLFKSAPRLIASAALLAAVLAMSPAQLSPAEAASGADGVALFFDDIYVATEAGGTGEAYNMQQNMISQGYTVNTFTGVAEAEWTAALTGAQAVVVPELEKQAAFLEVDMSAAAKTALTDYVSGGGLLIINRTSSGTPDNYLDFLNNVFGFALTTNTRGVTQTTAATGTAFEGCPATLPNNSFTGGIRTSSMPAGSITYYGTTTTGGADSSVAALPYGTGTIVYLGWDWYNSVPDSTQDGGWLCILDAALQEYALPPNPVSLTGPGDTTVECGAPSQLTFGVTEATGEATTVTFAVDGVPVSNETEVIAAGSTPPEALIVFDYEFTGPTNVVECTATNASGDTNACSVTVTVEDTLPPEVSVFVARPYLLPLYSGLTSVGLSVVASDACEGTLTPTSYEIYSDEPNGVAPLTPDAIGTGAATVRVRSERALPGDGRVYLIVVRAGDSAGNEGAGCATVVVPAHMTMASIQSVLAQAAIASTFCEDNDGAAPVGYTLLHSFSTANPN